MADEDFRHAPPDEAELVWTLEHALIAAADALPELAEFELAGAEARTRA